MSVKNEQQIYAEIGGLISQFCDSLNLQDFDWGKNILQWGQPTIQELPNPCILMNFYEGEKYGWVGTRYEYDTQIESGKAKISQYREIYFAISFYRDETELIDQNLDTTSFISAYDIANRLRMYFLSDFGIEALANLGYGSRNVDEINNPPLETDNETYARIPNFTIKLVIEEEIEQKADFVDKEQQFSNNDTTKNSKTKIIGV